MEVLDVDSEGHQMFEDFLSGLEYFAESLRNFRGQLDGMLEPYFEPLSQRNTKAYATLTLPTWQLRGDCFSRNRNLSRAFLHNFALSRRRTLQKEEKSFWRKKWSFVTFPTFSIPIFTGG